MDDLDPVPSEAAEARRRWQTGTDTFGRVYDVLLGTTSPTPYAEIAALADCSANAAKKHLDRLVEMGIACEADSQPARYVRNDAYLEWQEATRIAEELSTDEIIERVRALEEERDAYEEQFDATDPTAVSVFDRADHESIHEQMVALSDWHGIVRDIRLCELARQLARNDGHLTPA